MQVTKRKGHDCEPLPSKRSARAGTIEGISFGGVAGLPLFDHDPHPPITRMKRFLKKIGRGKSPKPLEQPIPLRKSTSIAARPPDHRAELDVTIPGDGGQNVSDNDLEADHTDLTVPPNGGGTIGPRVLFQDGMDGNQEFPASRTSTSCVAISGTDHRNQLTSASECSNRCDGPNIPHADLCFP